MPWDEREEALPTVPVAPDHEYDFPPEQHDGPAAALGVPCSDGPATMTLDRGDAPDRDLINEESPIEPGRQMEAGTDYDEEAVRRLAPLFTSIRADLPPV